LVVRPYGGQYEQHARQFARASVTVDFSPELRDAVVGGDITVSIRLWRRSKVKLGGRYAVGPAVIEVDSIELMPFGSIRAADVRLAGEPDLESLRRRAAHAGPIDADTLVYRIEFHLVED
jgi:hypothetical protein